MYTTLTFCAADDDDDVNDDDHHNDDDNDRDFFFQSVGIEMARFNHNSVLTHVCAYLHAHGTHLSESVYPVLAVPFRMHFTRTCLHLQPCRRERLLISMGALLITQ